MRPHPPLRRLLALALLAALGGSACRAPATGAEDVERPAPTRDAARELDYTETFEIRFDGERVGFLVEVLPTPDGVLDERAFAPGTLLIEDTGLQLLGFVSRHGTSYRFGEDGRAVAVGFGTRASSIAAFFRRHGAPELRSLTPGTVTGR